MLLRRGGQGCRQAEMMWICSHIFAILILRNKLTNGNRVWWEMELYERQNFYNFFHNNILSYFLFFHWFGFQKYIKCIYRSFGSGLLGNRIYRKRWTGWLYRKENKVGLLYYISEKNGKFCLAGQYTWKRNNTPQRTAGKIDGPFSMPMDRKERTSVTKSGEKLWRINRWDGEMEKRIILLEQKAHLSAAVPQTAETEKSWQTPWNAVNRCFRTNLLKKTRIPPISEWEQESNALKTQRRCHEKRKGIRADRDRFRKIRRCIDMILNAGQPEHARAKRQESGI